MVDTLHDLVRTPLFLLFLTLAAYQLGREIRVRVNEHPLAQPVLIAVIVVGVAITVLDIDYARYRVNTELIAFWLGPATVALAIPLHKQAHRLTGLVVPMLIAIVAGAAASITSGILLVRALGGDEVLQRTTGVKATTTPVAIALADSIGGIPALAAVMAILIGIFGAIAGPAVLTLLRIRDHRARGLALGAVSHGVGASRMLHEHETEGAFAGLSMGLTALAISALLPLFVAWLL